MIFFHFPFLETPDKNFYSTLINIGVMDNYEVKHNSGLPDPALIAGAAQRAACAARWLGYSVMYEEGDREFRTDRKIEGSDKTELDMFMGERYRILEVPE